jgi:hypothetical protein
VKSAKIAFAIGAALIVAAVIVGYVLSRKRRSEDPTTAEAAKAICGTWLVDSQKTRDHEPNTKHPFHQKLSKYYGPGFRGTLQINVDGTFAMHFEPKSQQPAQFAGTYQVLFGDAERSHASWRMWISMDYSGGDHRGVGCQIRDGKWLELPDKDVYWVLYKRKEPPGKR